MVRHALLVLFVIAILLMAPAAAFAEEDAGHLHVSPVAVLPFAALLLAIALLPLVAGHFWHSNRNKLLVAGAISLPVAAYLIWLGHHGQHALIDALLEYVQFIALLGSLYAVSGGIVLEGDLKPSAMVNVGLLLFGAVLANLIGTTGASMLLIRPFLKINAVRFSKSHLPVFFIFLVSNLGGLLTPLGDPPLFLGYLRGISFFWTLGLWKHWLLGVGVVAGVFFIWDTIAFRKEPKHEMENVPGVGRLRVRGSHNFLYLAAIVFSVLLLSPDFAHAIRLPSVEDLARGILGAGPAVEGAPTPLPVLSVKVGLFAGALFVLSVLSMLTTSKALRKENDFSWGAIIEVAVLFIGIFIAMVPALALLNTDGDKLGVTLPWQYFWSTGALSSFLDNAPTYVSFATLANQTAAASAGVPVPKDFSLLMTFQDGLILQAISVGAVFMGANTYIGNGPNFMVKAIADEAGYPTPSFFGYMLYSGLILIPTFVLITFVFFRG